MEKKSSSILVAYLLIALVAILVLQVWISPGVKNISYTKFKEYIGDKKITSVVISSTQLKGFEKAPKQEKEPLFPKEMYVTPRLDDPELISFLEKNQVVIVGQNENTFWKTVLSWVIPIALFMGIWIWFIRRIGQQQGMGSMMTLGKNKAKIIANRDVGVGFDDVAGLDEAKDELKEILDFLKNQKKFSRLGAKIPKGILLVGPPGTGKTLLARAVAGEAGVPFFSISGSDFIELFVGLGAARVRDLFEQAKKVAPCVIFIDELDALGKARGLGGAMSSHDEREQTLNQLLSEMDGFEPNLGVIILAATNRPEILDPALLRPGRFDRHILVDRPDLLGRIEILKIHTRKLKMAPGVNLETIARRTSGFTGADLANLANESALLAARRNKEQIGLEEIEEATDRIVAGLEKKNRHLNENEKQIVAFHETGHALMASARTTAEAIHKISIVPRGIAALGFTLQLPTEDRYLMSRTELLEKIDVLLGGRAAEELVFQDITTGAHNDLQKATDIARSMVALYGMNPVLGHVTYGRQETTFLQQPGVEPIKDYSDQTARVIDDEVRTLIETRMAGVKQTLCQKLPYLHRVAKVLLEKETLDGDEFLALLARPLTPEEENAAVSQDCAQPAPAAKA